jgi:hypothetical protein
VKVDIIPTDKSQKHAPSKTHHITPPHLSSILQGSLHSDHNNVTMKKPSTSPECSFRKSLMKMVQEEDDTPQRFLCPLSMTIMNDPVETPAGDNFERQTIQKYLKDHGEVCPISGRPLTLSDLTPNSKLQWEVLYWQRHAGCPSNLSISNISSTSSSSSSICTSEHDVSPRSSLSMACTPTTSAGRRKSLVRQDSLVDAAPRHPRRSSRCDKTLCLDESQHDAKPSVPRRKNSDHDLSNTFLLACQASLEASCTPKLFDKSNNNNNNNKMLTRDSMQGLMLHDFMNSMAMDHSPAFQKSIDRQLVVRSSSKSILSVLDEVEAAIAMDLFQ